MTKINVNTEGLTPLNDHSNLRVGGVYMSRQFPTRVVYIAKKFAKDDLMNLDETLLPSRFPHLFPVCGEFCGYLKKEECPSHDTRMANTIQTRKVTHEKAKMVSYGVALLDIGLSWPWTPFDKSMTVYCTSSRSLHNVIDVGSQFDVTRPDTASLRFMEAAADAVHKMHIESASLVSTASVEKMVQQRMAKAKALFSDIIVEMAEGRSADNMGPFDSKDSFVASLSQHQWARRYGEDRTWAASQWTGREWAGVNSAVLRVASADPKLRPKVEALLKHYEQGRKQIEIARSNNAETPTLEYFRRVFLRGFAA